MKTVLIGERYKELLEIPLKNQNFDVLYIPDNPNLDHRLAGHCDLSVFKYKNRIFLADYLRRYNLVNFFTNRAYNVEYSKFKQNSQYPNDVNLCCALIGDKLLHNPKFTDEEILNICNEIISVKQGYCRCTALCLNDQAVITSDVGIANTLTEKGFDVLLIKSGEIELPGYNYGFIGGASFVCENTVYFIGNIKTHSNGEEISKFIHNSGFNYINLLNDKLIDIGGAIVI